MSNNTIAPPEGFEKLNIHHDTFPTWDFDVEPVLQGEVIEARTVQIDRDNSIRDVRVAVVDVDGSNYTLWESAALQNLFNKIKPTMQIWVHSLGLKPLRNGRVMRHFDVYAK